MKKIIAILALITGFSSFGLSFDAVNFGYHGKYIWRGLALNQKPVNQGDISFSHGNFGFNAWWNFDVSQEKDGNRDQFTELDYTINYTTQLSGFDFEGGFIYYDFPRISTSTREFYLNILAPYLFSPQLAIYQDISATEGTYFELSFSEDFQVKFKEWDLPLSFSTAIGLNNSKNWKGYYNENPEGSSQNSGISNLTITLSSSYDLSDNMTLEPYVSFSALLNGAQNNDPKGMTKPTNLWVGINLAVKF